MIPSHEFEIKQLRHEVQRLQERIKTLEEANARLQAWLQKLINETEE